MPMELLQKYYRDTMAVLQVDGLYITMSHYSYYGHYKFHGKVTRFAKASAVNNVVTILFIYSASYLIAICDMGRVTLVLTLH